MVAVPLYVRLELASIKVSVDLASVLYSSVMVSTMRSSAKVQRCVNNKTVLEFSIPLISVQLTEMGIKCQSVFKKKYGYVAERANR